LTVEVSGRDGSARSLGAIVKTPLDQFVEGAPGACERRTLPLDAGEPSASRRQGNTQGEQHDGDDLARDPG